MNKTYKFTLEAGLIYAKTIENALKHLNFENEDVDYSVDKGFLSSTFFIKMGEKSFHNFDKYVKYLQKDS